MMTVLVMVMASKLYGVNATIIIFVFVLYFIVLMVMPMVMVVLVMNSALEHCPISVIQRLCLDKIR